MSSKKSKPGSENGISYKVTHELSDAMLKLERSQSKKWLKDPDKRAEELKNLALEKFPTIWERDSVELALRVDLDIYFGEVLVTDGDRTALMSPEEALNEFFNLDWDSNSNLQGWFEMLTQWVGDFGCLFTRGSGDHIGGWFEDPMWDVLSQIGAYEEN
jgi:hypothetical protein